jgi:hypothetical protein
MQNLSDEGKLDRCNCTLLNQAGSLICPPPYPSSRTAGRGPIAVLVKGPGVRLAGLTELIELAGPKTINVPVTPSAFL